MDSIDHKHFAGIPWCASHLQGDRIKTKAPDTRRLKPQDEDSLFADTLNSERGIVRMLQVYTEPPSPTDPIDDLKTFITLGSGLNGYPGICHGGMVMAILDDVTGLLVALNHERKTTPGGFSHMTAYLNTRFIKPVQTPATLLVRAWFSKVEGRKYFIEGTVEDEGGVVLARAEALFVQLKSSL
ncbi:HotDog domain-containing protein [Xylaria arbuscula]|nr:HotDog domain-containing protein [Xylaria arbuscula]